MLPGIGPAQPVLACGLNRAGYAGTSAALTTSIRQDDWAIAVDSRWIMQQVLNSVARQYGAIPPPTGAQPVLIQSDGSSQTWLDVLNIIFVSGYINVSGAFRREAGGLFGTTTVTW